MLAPLTLSSSPADAPLTAPSSPLTYLKDKVPFDTVKMFGNRQDVWWASVCAVHVRRGHEEPSATMVSVRKFPLCTAKLEGNPVTKLACMCLSNFIACTNSGCTNTQYILTYTHTHAHACTHTHTHTHTHTRTHTHIRGDRSPRAEDILLVASALLVLIRITRCQRTRSCLI